MGSTSGFEPARHQAAGHDGCLVFGEDEMIFAKVTNQQEVEFYNETQKRSMEEAGAADAALGSRLSEWMPVYLGTLEQNGFKEHDANSMVMPALKEDQAALRRQLEEGFSRLSVGNGSLDAQGHSGGRPYIVLQNLCSGFSRPSIMDVKLGSLLHDESADASKVQRLKMVSASTTSGLLGFRICGIKHHVEDADHTPQVISDDLKDTYTITSATSKGSAVVYDKNFGKGLTKQNVSRGLMVIFDTLPSKSIRRKVLNNFLMRLQLIYNCLLDAEVRIISGSLLFIVEGDHERWRPVLENEDLYESMDPLIREDFFDDDDDDDKDDEDGDDTKNFGTFSSSKIDDKIAESTDEVLDSRKLGNQPPLSSLNLIDFAHSKYVVGEGYDENIIEGVENLIAIFEEALQDL